MYFAVKYKSPVSNIILAASQSHIIGLCFVGQKYMDNIMPKDIVFEETPLLKEGIHWLDAYFEGKRPSPEYLPLSPRGSDFRKCIWQILKEIPYGETATYGAVARECAKRLGKGKMSAQAAGGAVGHNPISIIIPCHRVVGTNGSLTGYAGGIDKKIKLLTHEGVDMSRFFT